MVATHASYRRIYGALVCALTIIAVATASAQTLAQAPGQTPGQPATGNSADVPADAAKLPSISVTAMRNPVEVFEYPGMVTVVGRDSAAETQPSSIDDLLRHVPGLDFSNGPRRTGETPSIRSFSGPDVIILIDGARQNLESGHDGRFFVDPYFLTEAEVVRGSSSALYGSGSTGGIIALRSVEAGDLLKGTEKHGVETFAGFQGVNDEWSTGVLAFSKPFDNAGLLGGVVYRNSDDIELASNERLKSRDRIVSGLINGSFIAHEDHEFKLSLKQFNNDAREPNNGQSATDADAVSKDIRTNEGQISYAYSNPTNHLVDLNALLYANHTKIEESALTATSTSTIGDADRRQFSTVGLRVDNRSRFELSDSVLSVLTYGAEGYRDSADGDSNGVARSGVPSATSDFAGVFVQGQLDFEEILGSGVGATVTPGIRYDTYESSSSSAVIDNKSDQVSPKLSLQVRPLEQLSLFGSAARAFRAPTLTELFPTGNHFVIQGFGTNSFVSNPNLKPQTTDTFEAGAGLRFKSVLRRNDTAQIKATRFWIKGDNFIDTVVTQPSPPSCFPPNCNGTTTNVNVPNAELFGTEIEGSYESDRALIQIGFSQVHGENADTGEYLGSLTPAKFTLHTAAKLPEHSARIGMKMTYASDFDKTSDSSLMLDEYTVFDIYARWSADEKSMFPGLSITVGADNVFDSVYSRTASGAHEPGRNLKANVAYTVKW